MTHNEKKNQSFETDPQMTQMIKLLNKSIKIITTREVLMLKNPKERLTMLHGSMKDIKKKKKKIQTTGLGPTDKINNVCDFKNTLDEIDSRLDTAEEKISEVENLTIETKMKQKEKKQDNYSMGQL